MKGVKGYGFFIVLLVVIGIAYLCNNYIMDYDRDSYSVSQFKQDLQDKKIKKVTILDNCEELQFFQSYEPARDEYRFRVLLPKNGKLDKDMVLCAEYEGEIEIQKLE